MKLKKNSHYQNKKTKMRVYFISLLNICSKLYIHVNVSQTLILLTLCSAVERCSIWALQVRTQFMVTPQIHFYILCILFSLCFPVSSFLPIVQRALPTNLMKLPLTGDSYGPQQRWDCMVVQYQKCSRVHANTSGKTQYMYREQTPADFFPFSLKGLWFPWFFNR